MKTRNNDTACEEGREEKGDPALEFWSDEGARCFNEALDEGSAYIASGALCPEDCDAYLDAEDEYVDPELYDPDEETLPPGEMDLIFENCFIM